MKHVKWLLITSMAATPALAQDHYVRLGVGLVDYEDQNYRIIEVFDDEAVTVGLRDYDPGRATSLSLELGRSITPHWRAGISVEMTQASSESDSVSVTADGETIDTDITWRQKLETDYFMAHGYYHPWSDRNVGDFDPFVMASLGIALHELSNASSKNRDNDFESSYQDNTAAQLAWRLGAGLAYNLTDALTMDARVSYLDAGSISTGSAAITRLEDEFGTEPVPAPAEMDVSAYEVQVGIALSF